MFEYAPSPSPSSASSAARPQSSPPAVGMAQNDIKRVIAYSTCLAAGYMFFAAGVSAYRRGDVPLFHPRLFQGAPVPRRRLGHPRDERRTGHAADGWAVEQIPYTYAVMWIGSLSLAGIPFLRRLFFQGHDPERRLGLGDRGRALFVLPRHLHGLPDGVLFVAPVDQTFHGKPRADEETIAPCT